MTLVLAMGNFDHCVQVSDRLLTDGGGNPFVLPETKSTILSLADSRLLCGYAGLARVGRFRMSDWILDALLEAAKPDHLAHGTVERFTSLLTERFREPDVQGVSLIHRGVSVLFTGYRDALPPPNLIAGLVTNFQNFESGEDELPWDEFKATYWSIKRDALPEEATYVQRIGRWTAMEDPVDAERVHQALAERRGTDAMIEMGVGIIRKASGHRLAGGTIGMDINSAVLSAIRPPQLDQGEVAVQMGFHPGAASASLHGVNQVVSLPNFAIAIKEPTFGAVESDARPMAVRKVGRNKPCPCGSGQKYKKCCGA